MPQAGLLPPPKAAASRAASPIRQTRAAKAPPPPPAAPADVGPGSPAFRLPPHLQHAVHRALSDLQAQRLLYPQQCAAAEQAASGERRNAERQARALEALGGTAFGYAAAAAELDETRRAAKQLLRPCRGAGAGACSGAARAAAAPTTDAAAEPAAAGGVPVGGSTAAEGVADEQALWSSYEALEAAVTAEVDRRIAAARLHPPPAASRSPTRQSRRQQAAAAATEVPAAADRRPLGGVQHAAPLAATAERKRGRSPPDRPTAGPQQAAGRPKARAHPAAGPTLQAASSPSSKRPRPHVAFGTRCDAPRPTGTARGGQPLQLEASTAPTPPQLPPVHPAEPAAAKQPARREPPASATPAAAGAAAAARSDLLRSLAAAFAGGGASPVQHDSGGLPAEPAAGPAHQEGRGGSVNGSGEPGRMQQMLADLTAALQGMSLPAEGAAPVSEGAGGAGGSSPALQRTLQLHGLDTAAAQDASALLQAVLDRMDAIALRSPSPPPPGPTDDQPSAAGHRHGSPVAAPAGGLPLPPAGVSPRAEQLCSRLDRLVDASSAELAALQQEVAAAQRAEACADRINAAAIEAAVTGAEAAAAAAAAAAHRASSPQPAAQARLPQQAVRPASPSLGRQQLAAAQRCRSPPPPPAEALQEGPAVLSSGPPAGSPMPSQAALAATARITAAGVAPEPAPTADPQLTAAAPAEPSPPPAVGWPVQWPPPAPPALGAPLLLPLGQGQCTATWLPPATLGPAGSHVARPGAPPALGVPAAVQPCPGQPGEERQAGACQAFSVASSVQLPDSPGDDDDAPGSPCSPRSPASGVGGEPWADEGGQARHLAQQQQLLLEQQLEAEQAQQAAEEEEGERRRQALLDAAAERAIQFYRQHHDPEQQALEAAVDAACAWDVAMRARGGGAWDAPAAGADEPPPAALDEPGQEGEPACTAQPEDLAPAPVAAQHVPAPAATAVVLHPVAPAAAASLPLPSLQRSRPAPPPYNPLRAAAEQAAAARLAEEAAGWRRLRQRADELALWHEYAAALGMDAAPAAEQQQPAVGPPQLLEPPPSAGAAGPAEAPAAPPPRPPYAAAAAERHRLWRPGPPAPLPAQPAVELSPLPPPSTSGSGACSDGSSTSGTPASSSLLSSEASGSCLATEGSTSSLGIGARHKARALRYRLLRRRLEAVAAAGARPPPLADEPSEGCLTPLSGASLSTPTARPPSSWGDDLESLQECTPVAAPAVPVLAETSQLAGLLWDGGGAPGQPAAPLPSWPAPAAQPSPPTAQHSGRDTTPCAAACVLSGGLGDHLSDATSTPASSSCASRLARAAAAGRDRLLSGASCSSLQTVASGR